jgi:hypothetical protein
MEIDGLPVKNGTKKVTLHINQSDVRDGKGLDPGGCAAARCAIREGFSQARVHVHVTYLRKEGWKYWLRLETPESLQRELISLDRNGEFIPGDHVLRPPRPSKATGKRQGSNVPDKPRKLRKKRPRPYHVTKKVREFGANR